MVSFVNASMPYKMVTANGFEMADFIRAVTKEALPALPSLSQFGRGRLSLVTISFYALSLLFEPCRLLEFTLAGPH